MKNYIQKTKILLIVCLTLTFVVGFASVTPLGLSSAQNNALMKSQSQSMSNTSKSTNIVLVHGAWVDGSSWSKVIPILEKAGHKVISVQLALHSLADDVATVNRAIDLIGGPVILVGHSYGGIVISNAAYNNPKVTGLVYIAALAPQEGQSLGTFVDLTKFPKGVLVFDKGGFIYINSTAFPGIVAQDVNAADVSIAATAQKPINQSIFAEKSGPPAWKQLPTWYIVSENDHALPPALELQFAKQMNATTISLASSHASFLSHPNEVAQLILDAAKGAKK